MNELRWLEAESIYIFREVFAQFSRPVILFSGGKDSIVLTRLAEKAFYPGPIPMQIMLVDTGHNFPETLQYIELRMKQLKKTLVVASVQKSIDEGRVVEEKGHLTGRNRLQSVTLLDAIKEHKFDAVVGGARRDEEKSRAKERVFSLRNEFGVWDPKNQRPELWWLYNGRIRKNEHMRVFPLSNWTEFDVWNYLKQEQLPVPSIYFSHPRKCIAVGDKFLPYSNYVTLNPTDQIVEMPEVRVRTVGDMTCTTLFPSRAKTIDDILNELSISSVSERGGRMDDSFSDAAMEDRKKEGYF